MAKRKPGRPPAGDRGEKTGDYPKLYCVVKPETRAALDAVVALQQRSTWNVVDEALTLYFNSLPPADRRLIDAIVARQKNT